MKKHSAAWPIVVSIFPFLLYLRTLCPVLFAGDSSEFASVIQIPALAHPPGYPLYTILGYIFTRLPIGAPAYEANLLSAVFGALTCLAMYYVFLEVTKRPVSAAAAAILLGFGNAFWKLSSTAEVYTLATLMIAVVWLIAIRLGERPGSAGAGGFFWLGLLLSLGFANHQSIIFIVPGLVVYFILHKSFRQPGRAVISAIAGFVIGLALYLLLIPISHIPGPAVTPQINGIAELWRYATRQAYFSRSPESFGVEFTTGDLVGPADIAITMIKGLWDEWGPIFFLVAIGGLIYLFVKNRGLAWGVIISIAGIFIGVCFLTRGSPLGMPKIDLTAHELIPPLLPLFAFGFASAFGGAYEKLLSPDQVVGEESFIPKEKVPVFLTGFYVALPILLMLFNLDTADMRRHIFTDGMVRNALKGINTPATILTVGDEFYPFRYFIEVEDVPKMDDGSAADMQLIQMQDILVVEGGGNELNPDESIATKINQDLNRERHVYLTDTPSPAVQDLLRSGDIHIERLGLMYEAVPDSAVWAAAGNEFIRFANTGAEALIWELYELDHLRALDNVILDPLEKPYINRYYREAMNYGGFYFNRKDYALSWKFLDQAFQLAMHLDVVPSAIVPELAVSGYMTLNPKTPAILEYAVENDINFPERDPYRANIYFALGRAEGMKIAASIYSEATAALMDFPLVESLLGDDIDNEDYESAREKALELISRFVDVPTGEFGLMDYLSFGAALDFYPKMGDALWHLAFISALQDDKGTLAQVVKLYKEVKPDFLNAKVNILLSTNEFDTARRFYEAMVEYDPQDWKAQEGLAICMYEAGEVDEARELAASVIEHRPDSNNLRTILGLEPIEGSPDESENDEGRE